jgi:small basic protein
MSEINLRSIFRPDKRWVYLVLLVLSIAPLLQPWGLPIRVTPRTQRYHELIESLPAGSPVLVQIGIEGGFWAEVGPQSLATFRHLVDKDLRFIVVSFYKPEGQSIFESMIRPVIDEERAKYGVEWVNLGYVEGREAAMSSISENLKYTVKDAYGAPLDPMPVMSGLQSAEDLSLFIGLGHTLYEIRQIAVPNKLPCLIGALSPSLSDYLPFEEAGVINGLLGGIIGAAEYEYLLEKPGRALAGMDVLSSCQLFLLGVLIIANVFYLYRRFLSKKEEQ